MKAVRQKCEKGDLLWYDTDGGLIFAVAEGGWWGVWPDSGHLVPPVASPEDNLYVPVRGFGKVWHENNLLERLGWATTLEIPGEGEYKGAGDVWDLRFKGGGDEVFILLDEPPLSEPEPEPEPEPQPDEPPPLPIVPPPFAGWCRPPELVMFPSGKMRDMAFCTGATPGAGITLRVTWAYGYYITIDRGTGEITLRGETVEVFDGDDAAAFLVAWHLRQGHVG